MQFIVAGTVRACAYGGKGRFWRDLFGGKNHLAYYLVASCRRMIGEPDAFYAENSTLYDERRLDLTEKLYRDPRRYALKLDITAKIQYLRISYASYACYR